MRTELRRVARELAEIWRETSKRMVCKIESSIQHFPSLSKCEAFGCLLIWKHFLTWISGPFDLDNAIDIKKSTSSRESNRMQYTLAQLCFIKLSWVQATCNLTSNHSQAPLLDPTLFLRQVAMCHTQGSLKYCPALQRRQSKSKPTCEAARSVTCFFATNGKDSTRAKNIGSFAGLRSWGIILHLPPFAFLQHHDYMARQSVAGSYYSVPT